MSDLTAVDILIEPDADAIQRARKINRRMLQSVPDGITLDATHQPHITMLQRYLITADLDQAYEAIEHAVADIDPAGLAYHVPGISYSEHWGPRPARPPPSWASSRASRSSTSKPASPPPSRPSPDQAAPPTRS
jgi:hypothetical protein